MIGEMLGHYRVETKLGAGGMGVVYRAQDTHLGRPVAIKILPPESVTNAERKRRFIREARAASALTHPNIITIHDVDTEVSEGSGNTAPVDFIVMEYIEGRSLDQQIKRSVCLSIWRLTMLCKSPLGSPQLTARGSSTVISNLRT